MDAMNYEMGRFWLGALNLLGTVAVGVYTWIATRDKDNSQHIKAVEKALGAAVAAHSSRIERLESDIKHLPTQPEFAELQGDMRAMKATQEAVQRETHAMRLALTRIEDHLLKRG